MVKGKRTGGPKGRCATYQLRSLFHDQLYKQQGYYYWRMALSFSTIYLQTMYKLIYVLFVILGNGYGSSYKKSLIYKLFTEISRKLLWNFVCHPDSKFASSGVWYSMVLWGLLHGHSD